MIIDLVLSCWLAQFSQLNCYQSRVFVRVPVIRALLQLTLGQSAFNLSDKQRYE